MQVSPRFDASFILFFLSLVLLAVIHYLAINLSLYWIYPWLDIPIHFLGGAVVALGTQSSLFKRIFKTSDISFIKTLLIVLFVGTVWEVFEWRVGIVDSIKYAFDTGLDICMDLLGGVIGFVTAKALSHLEQ